LVQDLSSLQKTLGRRIDAIVGLDVLGKNSFSINYRTKRLRFGPVEGSRSTVSFETGQPLVTVEARLHNLPVLLLVDTGAAALLLFQSRFNGPIWRRFSTSVGTDPGHAHGERRAWHTDRLRGGRAER
jgi:hypothetical protein